MSFQRTYNKYIIKNQFHIGRENIIPSKLQYDAFIIIPAYNELDYIFKTLSSINGQKIKYNFLVIIVINNSNIDQIEIKNNNKKLYQKLILSSYKYELVILDCFSNKHAFIDEKSGVGWARKIGMDFCINFSNPNSLLCCIDADTIIDKNYFKIIFSEYKKNNFSAAVVNFSHQKTNNYTINKNISKYEKILKYNARELYKINSPYGYISMGSTMICTMTGYIKVGGMITKKATEDFYFLQKLAKYDGVYNIPNILVYPSSRAEQRVYLGTGFRMRSMLKGESIEKLKILNDNIQSIKLLYDVMNDSWDQSIQSLLADIKQNDYHLWKFLITNNFKENLLCIQKNNKGKKQFINQFHNWFDNFKIHRYVSQSR